jgi:hypothetical protein
MLGTSLRGNEIAFSFYNADGTLRSVRGNVNGDKFNGWLRLEGYDTPLTGRRVPQAPAKKA